MNAIDIVCRAMRRIGVLASGHLPTDDELDDAVETLRSILVRAISEGGFGVLEDDLATGETFVAEEFTRVFRNDIDTTSIELPETVTDAVTGELRAPLDRAVIAIADQFTNQLVHYIYDGDLKLWLGIETIDSTSTVPLASRDANGLACMLAVEIADEYGQTIGEATALGASRWHSNILNDWSREGRTIPRPTNYF